MLRCSSSSSRCVGDSCYGCAGCVCVMGWDGFAFSFCFLLYVVCEERVLDACMYVCAHMELSTAQQSGQQGVVFALQSSHNQSRAMSSTRLVNCKLTPKQTQQSTAVTKMDNQHTMAQQCMSSTLDVQKGQGCEAADNVQLRTHICKLTIKQLAAGCAGCACPPAVPSLNAARHAGTAPAGL